MVTERTKSREPSHSTYRGHLRNACSDRPGLAGERVPARVNRTDLTGVRVLIPIPGPCRPDHRASESVWVIHAVLGWLPKQGGGWRCGVLLDLLPGGPHRASYAGGHRLADDRTPASDNHTKPHIDSTQRQRLPKADDLPRTLGPRRTSMKALFAAPARGGVSTALLSWILIKPPWIQTPRSPSEMTRGYDPVHYLLFTKCTASCRGH